MHFQLVTGLKKIKRPTTYLVKREGHEFHVPNPSIIIIIIIIIIIMYVNRCCDLGR